MTRKSVYAILAAALAVAWAGPAAAGSKSSLAAGGRTIGGPGDSTIAASATETVASQVGSDGCATVVNTGNAAVDLSLIGNGTATVNVASRKTVVLCRSSLATVNIICQAVGSSTCSVSWRIDAN